MNYYINKNGKQLGPFSENDILVKVSSGEFSPNDLCIPHGGSEWKPISQVLPKAATASKTSQQPAASAPASPPKKRRWGMILGIFGVLVVGIVLIGGILGFFAYRNLFPGDSLEDLPEQVKEFKLEKRFPGHGDIWGSKQWYAGMYSVPPSKDFLAYLMDVYKSESAAKDEMEKALAADCEKGAAKPMYFTFKKDGKEVAEGATCFAGFYIHRGNRVATVAKIGESISIEDMAGFMEDLPFVVGSKMTAKD
jgi:hypothetical protein